MLTTVDVLKDPVKPYGYFTAPRLPNSSLFWNVMSIFAVLGSIFLIVAAATNDWIATDIDKAFPEAQRQCRAGLWEVCGCVPTNRTSTVDLSNTDLSSFSSRCFSRDSAPAELHAFKTTSGLWAVRLLTLCAAGLSALVSTMVLLQSKFEPSLEAFGTRLLLSCALGSAVCSMCAICVQLLVETQFSHEMDTDNGYLEYQFSFFLELAAACILFAVFVQLWVFAPNSNGPPKRH